MYKKRIMALDYGRRRIGVAVSDILGITAQGKPTLIIKNKNDTIKQIISLINEYDPSKIVCGLPLDKTGGMSEMAKEVKKFGAEIEKETNLSVEYLDERFTSIQAKKTLIDMGIKPSRKKPKVDSMSAVLILQNYMEINNIGGI
jgi:putative Holliday junction resolvase